MIVRQRCVIICKRPIRISPRRRDRAEFSVLEKSLRTCPETLKRCRGVRQKNVPQGLKPRPFRWVNVRAEARTLHRRLGFWTVSEGLEALGTAGLPPQQAKRRACRGLRFGDQRYGFPSPYFSQTAGQGRIQPPAKSLRVWRPSGQPVFHPSKPKNALAGGPGLETGATVFREL